MARIRTIKPEFPQSETIGAMSRDARLLFVQLWTIVDDAGRARAASRMLASLLYPYDDDARDLIDGWLDELEDAGAIRRYEADGGRYLEITKWLEHQKIDRPSPSRLPEYREPPPSPREKSRASDADLGPRTSTKTKDQDHSRSVAVAPRPERDPVLRVADEEFERLWQALPKRDGPNPKEPARKKFLALVKTGVPAEAMIQGALQAADAARKRGDEGSRFIPQAVTWLNQNRWTDAAAEAFAAQNRTTDERSRDNRTAGVAGRAQASGDATLAGLGRLAARIRERGVAEREVDQPTAGINDPNGFGEGGSSAPRVLLIEASRQDAEIERGRGSRDTDDDRQNDAGVAGPESDGGQRGSEGRGLFSRTG